MTDQVVKDLIEREKTYKALLGNAVMLLLNLRKEVGEFCTHALAILEDDTLLDDLLDPSVESELDSVKVVPLQDKHLEDISE